MKLHLNPNLFFLMNAGNIVAWDYKNHNQFELEKEYFERLQFLSASPIINEIIEIDEDLISGGLLSKTPFETVEWGWDILSLIYHFGTQDIGGNELIDPKEWLGKYIEVSSDNNVTFSSGVFSAMNDPIQLPNFKEERLLGKRYGEVLKLRKTSRDFNGQPISLEELSTILFATFGKFHGEWNEIKDAGYNFDGFRRTSPSGGALHPIEPYIFCYNVSDLKSGIYYYQSNEHRLFYIDDIPEYRNLSNALYSQYYVEGIALGIVFVGFFSKAWGKYPHSRSYKDVYLDCGHLSQTCLLTSTALSLKTWITAWFNDSKLSSLLHVSGVEVAPISFIGIGHGSGSAIPSTKD